MNSRGCDLQNRADIEALRLGEQIEDLAIVELDYRTAHAVLVMMDVNHLAAAAVAQDDSGILICSCES